MPHSTAFHRMPWGDFDAFARLSGDASMIGRLRGAEHSRRKLLVHALLESSAKVPGAYGPLPPLEVVWELLARVENVSPAALDRAFAHPYTGSWAGYATRLLNNGVEGICPLWMHLGHLHALAASAAIMADLEFEISVPLWEGNAVLPSLGTVRLPATTQFSTAVVRGGRGRYVVSGETGEVRLPARLDSDSPGWWHVRRCIGGNRLSVILDDLDPYRGLHEPLLPERLELPEVRTWRRLLGEAWSLLTDVTPELAGMVAAGLDSVVPKPNVPFQNPSASTGEAFGSAVIGLPTDAADLAATLVHEFQHIALGGILHMTQLYENDRTERIFVPWRDDPRPLSGALQGVYAFFGVTAFWRGLARTGSSASRRASFEFAFWRGQTWRTLVTLRRDVTLTDAGQRFLAGVAEVLEPWQHEPVPEDVQKLADTLAADHRAGWLLRHRRPDPARVAAAADAWLSGRARPPVVVAPADLPPTPVPDGPWSRSRSTLVRLGLSEAGHTSPWQAVPEATEADLALVRGRFTEAAQGYRAELRTDPDRPASLVGLGLALAGTGPDPAARALLHCPEVVRAVHRELRRTAREVPAPEELARWLGQLVSG